MGDVTTTQGQTTSPTETLTPSPPNGSNNKLVIIIVSCIGGFLAVLTAVCIIVPLLRRRVARRASRDLECGTPSPDHTRHLSEAGAPLLPAKAHGHESSEHSIYAHGTPDSHESPLHVHDLQPVYTDLDSSPADPPSPTVTSTSHAENSGVTLSNSWGGKSDFRSSDSALPPGAPISRLVHAPLRRTRTRIRAPMAAVPEDIIPSPAPLSPPLPPSPSEASEHPSWLRIPSTAPLITAFRRSVAASTSSRATSVTSLSGSAHAHAFPTPAPSSDALTFRSFTSAASSGHTPPLPKSPELQPRDVPARLRPSDPARVAQLVPGPLPGGGPGSRAASLLGGSAQTGSRSDLSVYTDARSNFDASELGERR
ncbi:hypothetical protein K488DRAFT_83602 [Vararia minispora EC-137]|uniref:Uncharacterized protein n=1 Tax=Vararia minispora EC-137 TaxID=1314806 RepID=A0ACB8QT76_9AGAM|nr:hypothetical protein K488DRAFT_83602 [Vararia minispora EC-137]